MISLHDAQVRTLSHVQTLDLITCSLADALGGYLGRDVVSRESIPPFDNTAVDGFGVISSDVAAATRESGVTLHIIGTIAAGDDPGALSIRPGQAMRIMTGAALAKGIDSIVMVEDTSVQGNEVQVFAPTRLGENIRQAGSDVVPDQTVATKGSYLSPALIGVLASLGERNVWVIRRPRVGVVSTGDELSDEATLAPGKIRDSNRPALMAMVAQLGAIPIDLGTLADDRDTIRNGFLAGIENCDAIVTTGGVSVGDFDYTKLVLKELGEGSMEWLQIAIKPAKPYAVGTIKGKPVFCLPGNPVSSLVSFTLLVAPALLTMAGAPNPYPVLLKGRCGVPFPRSPDNRLHLVRSTVSRGKDGVLEAAPLGLQGSHILTGLAGAQALALVPDGAGFAAGDPIELLPMELPRSADNPF